MNKILIPVGLAVLPALLGACSSNNAESAEEIIEKPEVKIENGMLTPEVLEAFGRISQITPSPDGELIAFTLSYESIEQNKANAEIYTMKPDGSDMKRLTKTPSSESNLAWIEDGKRLAFIAKDDKSGKPQVHAMNPDGSGKKCLTEMENGVECFKFSPDGKKIVVASTIKPYNENEALFEGLPKTSGRVVDDLMYKHWDEWVTEIPHPFLGDFDGSQASGFVDIMEGEPFECPMRPFGGAESFAFSPDSKQLIYVSRKLKGMDYAFSTDSNLYLYDIEQAKTVKNLTEGMPGYDTDPVYSPDGSQLAFLSMATAKYESDKKRLMVMDMKSFEMRDLTADWKYWPEELAWEPDGKSIVFAGYSEGTEPVFRINVADAKVTQLTDGMWDYHAVIPFKGNLLALRHNMLQPDDLVEVPAAGGEVKQITEINKDILSQLAEVKVEKRMVPTSDGKEMTCWVILPANFDPNKQYPAILYCQGGPQQAVSQFWSYRWNFRIMAANGYVVIAPNRRGVPGFGEEWNRQISGDYGGQNMRDYLAATDYIAAQPYVDAKRVGAIGASYGGFSVYWLAGHHEGRFAALVAHAGIFNIEAQYLETEEMWFADFDMGGAPWEKDNATAQRTFATSPHKFVDNWTAPILITVGELDYRILASQGMMAFNAAKMHGLETEMLVFPDENHWVLQPQNAILWQRVFFRFLDKYLKSPKADAPAADSAK
ncbi:MAG: S9 family peptidase [Bacteroides sp.]|nr:S9 family peptidase [Bacteroides sp.]MBD5338035.1 S9 family peptidase [Bacteroides sp.]